MQIPVSGFVRPVIAVTPPVADFGKIELKEPLKQSAQHPELRDRADQDHRASTGACQGIDAKSSRIEDGREYQVRITFNPELGKGPFNGKLMIRTDSPKIPLIEVELKGIVL